MTPNLPSSSNLYLLMAFAGGYFFYFLLQSQAELKDQYQERIEEVLDIRNEMIENERYVEEMNLLDERMAWMDSLGLDSNEEIEIYNNLLAKKRGLYENYRINTIILQKKDEMNADVAEQTLNFDKSGDYVILIGGILVLGFSLVKLNNIQIQRDRILEAEYFSLKVKSPECQSCGMRLKYDINFDEKSNYCSNCFRDGEFLDDSTFEEFQDKVRRQMIMKGFSERKIVAHLKKMKKLERWKMKFDWRLTTEEKEEKEVGVSIKTEEVSSDK